MEVRSNNIGDIRSHYKAKLLDFYDEREADNLLLLLIQEYTGISKAMVFSEPGLTINESELLKIHFAVKDLKNSKPIQYILGKTEFYGMQIEVSPDVLIPRPETEELLELVTKENIHRNNLNILDVGTGSGCLAIGLKKILADSHIIAIDISPGAIELAKKNAKNNSADIEFIQQDFLNDTLWNRLGTFDIIVSNPPYVRCSEKAQMKKNVLNFEPSLALFVEVSDPLIFYKAIASFAKDFMRSQGKIYCEINQYLGEEAKRLFEESKLGPVRLLRDMNGNNRKIKVSLK